MRWSVQVKASPDVMKIFGYGGPDCFYSLDGKKYQKGMQWSWINITDASQSDKIFLKFRSFEGEEIGPFQYQLDFKTYAIGKLKKGLEDQKNLINCYGTSCTLGWRILQSLAAIDRIEYAFNPEFAGKRAIEIPVAEFSKYFDNEWARSQGLRLSSEPVVLTTLIASIMTAMNSR